MGRRMRLRDVDTDRDVLIVAEIGNNHESDSAPAEELIGLAAEAGVGAPTAIGDGTPYGCAGRRLDRCPGDQMINLRSVGRYLDRSAAANERRCRRAAGENHGPPSLNAQWPPD